MSQGDKLKYTDKQRQASHIGFATLATTTN